MSRQRHPYTLGERGQPAPRAVAPRGGLPAHDACILHVVDEFHYAMISAIVPARTTSIA